MLAATVITLAFEPGRANLTGTAGCNRYMAQVDAGEGRFTASALGTTKMSCAPEIMDQEAAFLTGVQAARRYAYQDGRLILPDADGQPALVFAAPK